MNIKRKICVITGTRAEYGLMYWLLKLLQEDKNIELQIIATGMHLSPEFGLTYKMIEEQGFTISKKIEILLSSDTSVGISKSMGLALISFSEAYLELNPDIIVVLGDRFEIFAAVSAAMISRLPVGHIHGGEATEGLIDEAIRHSITKMSHLHFTASEVYKNRVIQLGEQPERVFNTGAPGLDNVYYLDLLDKKELENSLGFKLGSLNFLVTFHPVTLETNSSVSQFSSLLEAIMCFPNASVIFTLPNSDTDGRIIIEMIDKFVKDSKINSVSFTSLGQLRYLSSIKFMDVVIGNSSSGLTEVPSFKKPTVNIGDRQNGRLKASSVIDCKPNKESIQEAIEMAISESFSLRLKGVVNPYGVGGASKKIHKIIKSFPFDGIIKKKFNDL